MRMRAMNGAGIAIEFPLPLHARRGRMIGANIRRSPPL
jgi:hypothetical protein